jgi:hypothetical protein
MSMKGTALQAAEKVAVASRQRISTAKAQPITLKSCPLYKTAYLAFKPNHHPTSIGFIPWPLTTGMSTKPTPSQTSQEVANQFAYGLAEISLVPSPSECGCSSEAILARTAAQPSPQLNRICQISQLFFYQRTTPNLAMPTIEAKP